jgi:hypothetical protein
MIDHPADPAERFCLPFPGSRFVIFDAAGRASVQRQLDYGFLWDGPSGHRYGGSFTDIGADSATAAILGAYAIDGRIRFISLQGQCLVGA